MIRVVATNLTILPGVDGILVKLIQVRALPFERYFPWSILRQVAEIIAWWHSIFKLGLCYFFLHIENVTLVFRLYVSTILTSKYILR